MVMTSQADGLGGGKQHHDSGNDVTLKLLYATAATQWSRQGQGSQGRESYGCVGTHCRRMTEPPSGTGFWGEIGKVGDSKYCARSFTDACTICSRLW